jgi:hypothetical protein
MPMIASKPTARRIGVSSMLILLSDKRMSPFYSIPGAGDIAARSRL